MADGHHLKVVKSQYLGNGLTDRRKIWHDDDIWPNELYSATRTLRLLFCIIKQ